MFKGAGLVSFHILALFALAQVGAVHSLLVTLAVLLLTETLPAIAPLEVPLLLISHSQQPEI